MKGRTIFAPVFVCSAIVIFVVRPLSTNRSANDLGRVDVEVQHQRGELALQFVHRVLAPIPDLRLLDRLEAEERQSGDDRQRLDHDEGRLAETGWSDRLRQEFALVVAAIDPPPQRDRSRVDPGERRRDNQRPLRFGVWLLRAPRPMVSAVPIGRLALAPRLAFQVLAGNVGIVFAM